MLRAQSHTGAFFFPKFLTSPILKRDSVFREIFSLYEVERMLGELGYGEHGQSIVDEIRRRGTAAHLKGLAKRRYRLRLLFKPTAGRQARNLFLVYTFYAMD